MRRGEIASVQWKDLDLKRRLLAIPTRMVMPERSSYRTLQSKPYPAVRRRMDPCLQCRATQYIWLGIALWAAPKSMICGFMISATKQSVDSSNWD
ncbi:hypothetical protein IVA82_24520 [Bradyrhizobium sp. 142]|nr:hypothetical protein [Bradyrhizobium sp. 142]